MITNHKLLRIVTAVLCMVSMLCFQTEREIIYADTAYSFVVLSSYEETMNIGDELYLWAYSTDGKKISFSSSNSKVASVNSYGCITAKKSGTAKITAKTRNGESSCRITVKKTTITLNEKSVSLENGSSFQLKAKVSTGHEPVFKSKKKSVATVDEHGLITAVKPGETTVTVSVDGTEATCKVKVKQPKVVLSKTSITLYRKGEARLFVTSTSKSTPKWKTNKSSIATVDQNGVITAVKHGTAIITVTVDGVSKTCEVIVKQPTVKLDQTSMSLAVGQSKIVTATVSSGNAPTFSSSNTSVATVDEYGTVTAAGTGKAYIYAVEDGVKAKLTVTVK